MVLFGNLRWMTHFTWFDTLPQYTGDFNHDGNLDLLVMYMCSRDEYGNTCKCLRTDDVYYYINVAILFGNGDGTFSYDQKLLTVDKDYKTRYITYVDDFNNDNYPDVFCAVDELYVFLGSSDGSFRNTWYLDRGKYSPWEQNNRPFLSDVDKDGYPDIVSIGYKTDHHDFSDKISYMKSYGDGTFGEEIFGEINMTGLDGFQVSDINNDNKDDFIVEDNNNLYVFIQQENISFIENEFIDQSNFQLFQNTPNPFNPLTTIEFLITEPEIVNLDVFNISGQKVTTLVDGAMATGKHTAVFDGSDLASGMYFYRFTSSGMKKTGRMMLVK